MRASEILIHTIPTIAPKDTVSTALKLMSEFHISQLPLVKDKQFLGLIAESDIKSVDAAPSASIESLNINTLFPGIHDYEHMFEVLKAASTLKLKAVPVVDKDNNYLGSISSESLLQYLATETDIIERGGIIVLDIAINDYSLAEVARIVEMNGAKILTVFAGTDADLGRVELTIKINSPNVQPIVQAFERYNYTIKDTYQEQEFYENLRNRYDALMNYLNV